MNPENEQQLERLIGRELERLPELPAPGSLVHRVMLAVHRRERLPWYRRAWPAWPLPARAVSLGAMVMLALGLVLFWANPAWIPGLGELQGRFAPQLAALGSALEQALVLLKALLVMTTALGREILLFGALLVLVAYGCSVALLTACYRLAHQRVG
jgi:hypothetical protein